MSIHCCTYCGGAEHIDDIHTYGVRYLVTHDTVLVAAGGGFPPKKVILPAARLNAVQLGLHCDFQFLESWTQSTFQS